MVGIVADSINPPIGAINAHFGPPGTLVQRRVNENIRNSPYPRLSQ
jgi:hypothetical protein